MFKKPLFFVLLSSVVAGNAAASVALPHVNPNSVVSARELFGHVSVAPLPREQRQVVTRSATPAPVQATATVPVHVPVQQTARTDILSPRRPDANLWARGIEPSARGYEPLRMPHSHEFALFSMNNMDDNFELPREELSPTGRPTFTPPVITPAPIVQAPVHVSVAPPTPVPAAPSRIENRFAARPSPTAQNHGPVVAPIAAPQRLPTRTVEVVEVNWAEPEQLEEPASPSLFAWEPSDELRAEIARPRQTERPLSQLNPLELRDAFQRTFTAENRHLSAFRIDDRFDSASPMITEEFAGFEAIRELGATTPIQPLEIKVMFRGNDSSLSRDNFQLISEYAGLVVRNPQRAVQISIPERAVATFEGRRLAARRYAIIEQVLRDNGIPENRIVPVLVDRADDSFVLRIISLDVFQTLTEQRRNMFGDVVEERTTRRLAW